MAQEALTQHKEIVRILVQERDGFKPLLRTVALGARTRAIVATIIKGSLNETLNSLKMLEE